MTGYLISNILLTSCADVPVGTLTYFILAYAVLPPQEIVRHLPLSFAIVVHTAPCCPTMSSLQRWYISLAEGLRRPNRERTIPGSNPVCAGIFSESCHTSDLKIDTPVASLPGAWRYRVSADTGRPGVSIL